MVNFATLIPFICNGYFKPLQLYPFLQNRDKINKFCILSVINQTQEEVLNINDTFWAISTLQNSQKLYITCLQYRFSITLCFPYNIIYLPNGYKVNAITFVLPSNNKLNVGSIMEPPENKLGVNRSYSKINNFSLFNPKTYLFLPMTDYRP